MGISSMRRVWAVLLCVVWVPLGAAASDVDPAAAPPELRAEICETAKRAATLRRRLHIVGLDEVAPELMSLIEESEAYLTREQMAAKYFAIHLRRGISSAIITYPDAVAFRAQVGLPTVPLQEPEKLNALWERCRVNETQWLKSCVIPGTTMAEWAAGNDIGIFLEDPRLVAPLPPHTQEWMKTQRWDVVPYGQYEGEANPVKLGGSILFAEACLLVQSLRDLDHGFLPYLSGHMSPEDMLLHRSRRDSLMERVRGVPRIDWVEEEGLDEAEQLISRLASHDMRVLTLYPFFIPESENNQDFIALYTDYAHRQSSVREPRSESLPPLLDKNVYVLDEERYPEAPSPDWSGFEFGQTAVFMLPGEIPLEMVLVPAGSFLMGSRLGTGRKCERPAHVVEIDCEFYIGRYEITQEQWTALMGTNPSDPKSGVGPKHPVQNISWDDVQAFLAALNRLGAGHFRLPSEAEWEYACRAGSTTRYCFGDDRTMLGDYAWHSGNSNVDGTGQKAQPVGRKVPNMFGLYDMHGNVAEFCEDIYYPDYTRRIHQAMDSTREMPSLVDWPTPDSSSTLRRVLRGGAFIGNGDFQRSAARQPGTRGSGNLAGLRVVRER